MSRTYEIRTFGCQMNVHDSERAAGLLESLGYRPAPADGPADLVLLNTCAVRENADNKLYGTLGHLKRDKEAHGTTIVVGGCLAQKDGQTVAEKAPWVDLVYGTHNIADLPDLLMRADSESVPVVELVEQLETFPSALPAKREVRHHAWTSISVGCDNTCTFCIVPSLRGPERSRMLGDVVAEVQSLVADGVVEVTLLGQNVNSYGRDLKADGGRGPSRFAELLRAVGEVDGIERVRFTSPHPRDFTEDVLHTMAEVPAVCEHLHLPLQSGSDRVLKDMRRSYRSRRFLDLVERTRELMPDAALTTDIIVGFPGETDEDFEQTLEVVAASRFDQAFTFQYSPRPGTPAAEMVDRFVDPDVVRERYHRLEELTRQHSLQAHERLVGRPHELLVESVSKTDSTRWSARTRGNHLVHLPAPTVSGALSFAPGDLVTAVVTDASANYALADAPTAVRHTAAGRATAAAMQQGQTLAEATRPGGLTAPVGTPTVSGTRRALPVV